MTALMGLAARLRLARLYLCTDARSRQGDLAEFLAAAFAGGVDIVQIRQPALDPQAELTALEVAREAAQPHQGIVCASGSPALAGRASADMLHLSQADGSAKRARRSVHEWALIGRSTSSPRQLKSAIRDDDLHYLWVGPVHASPGQRDAEPSGLDLIRYAASRAPAGDLASKPWFAVGGINAQTIDDVLAAGARRVGVGRAITEASDPQAAAESLSGRLRSAWRDDPQMERYTFAATAQGFSGGDLGPFR